MSVPHALLTRAPHATRPTVPVVAEVMALDLARLHEVCGPARRVLALATAAVTRGPVIWIAPGWSTERLNGPGLTDWIDPGRLILAEPRRADDLLWAMEESLRSGAAALVVAELPEPPALTPVRRLHLAAETGAAEGRTAPLGLILTPGSGGAPGVESRWSLTPTSPPAEGADARLRVQRVTHPTWTLSRLRARTAPPAHWPLIARRAEGDRLRLVPHTA